MAPAVSILLKSFNHADYVGEAVRSVLGQTLGDFELLIADDASSDASQQIVESFTDERIIFERSESNRGISATMNRLFARSRGDLIAILNSDDIAMPERLATQAAYLFAHPEIAAVFSAPKIIGADSEPVALKMFDFPFDHPYPSRFEWLRYFFFNGNCLCAPSAMIRREAYRDAGDYDPRLTNLNDLDRWVRLLEHHDLHVVPDGLTAYRWHPGNENMSAPRPDTILRGAFEFLQVLKRYKDFSSELLERIFAEDIAKHQIRTDRPKAQWLAEIALLGKRAAHHMFALDTLHECARVQDDCRKLWALTGSVDVFSLLSDREELRAFYDKWLEQVKLVSGDSNGRRQQEGDRHQSPDSAPLKAAAELLGNSAPSISVVMPIFNGGKFLAAAVKTVFAQTLLPVELILVDDESTDGALASLELEDIPFTVISVRQKNAGQSAARNMGASLATGDYLAFLDQDDLWYETHLQDLHQLFIANPKISWAVANVDRIDEDGHIIARNFLDRERPGDNNELGRILSRDLFMLPSATLIKREDFKNVGGFDENLSGYEDDDLFLRLFYNGHRYVYTPQALGKWRIYNSSCSYSPRMNKSRRRYAEKLIAMFPNNPDLAQWWVRDVIAPRFFADAMGRYERNLQAGRYELCTGPLEDAKFYARHAEIDFRKLLKLKLMGYPQVYVQLSKLFRRLPR